MLELEFGNGNIIVTKDKSTITLSRTKHKFDIGQSLENVCVDDEIGVVSMSFNNADSVDVFIEALDLVKLDILRYSRLNKSIQAERIRIDSLICFCNTGKFPRCNDE